MEKWKQYYNTIYWISSKGRVYSTYGKGRFLKLFYCKDGYLNVGLTINKVKKHYKVHRLVGKMFIPNPENKPEINHINEIRDCNTVENLEWCTRSENINHGNRNSYFYKSIIQLDAKTNKVLNKFKSVKEAGESLNINPDYISFCLTGKRKTTCSRKYKWCYAE